MMLAVGLSNLTFIMLRYITTILKFSRTFIMLDFCQRHFCVCWDDHIIFKIIYMIQYIWWHIFVEPILHFWDKANLTKVDDLGSRVSLGMGLLLLSLWRVYEGLVVVLLKSGRISWKSKPAFFLSEDILSRF